MEASELGQFITVLVIALGALIAAPGVYFLAEASRAAVERERGRDPRKVRRAPRRPVFHEPLPA
jgi:hypothetical protein